jgi:acetoacetyl-CoA reductase
MISSKSRIHPSMTNPAIPFFPSAIATELLMARYADEDKKRKLLAEIPVGRLGKPEDIAGLVAFLLSSWGDYICGQQLAADGGRTLFNRQ